MSNLKPHRRSPRAIARASTRTLGHIRRHRPLVAIRPRRPGQANRTSRRNRRAQRRRSRARVLIPTALKVHGGDILYWAVSCDFAEDSLGWGGVVGVGVGEVAGVCRAADHGGGDVSVPEDAGGVEEDRGGCGD